MGREKDARKSPEEEPAEKVIVGVSFAALLLPHHHPSSTRCWQVYRVLHNALIVDFVLGESFMSDTGVTVLSFSLLDL